MTTIPGAPACPTCRARLDSTTSFDGMLSIPEPGHATICIHCGTPGIFEGEPDGTLSIRLATPTEIVWMMASLGQAVL